MNSKLYSNKFKKDWFRIKQYPHIGLPLEFNDRKWIQKYVSNPKNIESHSFFPFIHRTLLVRKFRRAIDGHGIRSKRRIPDKKIREVFYSNHVDSNIYSYYSELLSKHYEKKLVEFGVSECVTAYRKIPLKKNHSFSRNKCNIDFANDVFNYIKSNKTESLVAITFDIKSFFDTLDHKKIKESWCKILNYTAPLPPDHYNVFRNITKFSFIEEKDIFNLFKDRIIAERNPNIIKSLNVKKRKYLRNKRAIAYCRNQEIELVRSQNLIKANKYEYDKGKKTRGQLRTKGIPQGSPISATLANVYMLDFDKQMNELLTTLKGIYRRYSDDMVVICHSNNEKYVIKQFEDEIKKHKLEIQPSKTQVFLFEFDKVGQRFCCKEKNLKTGLLSQNRNFEYLGFQFDGFYTLLKNSSLSGYYRNMKRSIGRGKFYSIHNRTKTKGELFKSRLYKRFTHLGAQRRRKYERDKKITDKFVISQKYDWGNFISYAKLAAKVIPNNKIKGQIKNHWKIFHKLLK